MAYQYDVRARGQRRDELCVGMCLLTVKIDECGGKHKDDWEGLCRPCLDDVLMADNSARVG